MPAESFADNLVMYKEKRSAGMNKLFPNNHVSTLSPERYDLSLQIHVCEIGKL